MCDLRPNLPFVGCGAERTEILKLKFVNCFSGRRTITSEGQRPGRGFTKQFSGKLMKITGGEETIRNPEIFIKL